MADMRKPTPRIGDVIYVAKGGCHEYRTAFRLRVAEIITHGRPGQRLDRPIIGGAVINADGRERLVKGAPVERAMTVAAPSLVTVITPAPATEAEIRDAYADHGRRETERTRCDHPAGVLGCAHPECLGVPPVDGATDSDGPASDAASPGESGIHEWARALRSALASYPGIGPVEMPQVTYRGEYSPAGVRRDGRRYMVATALVKGHTVHVIDWETRRYAYVTAITVDGVLINADVTDGRAMTATERARMVAWRVADAIRQPAPVAQVAPVAPVRPATPVARGEGFVPVDPAKRALATMAALTADIVHVASLYRPAGAHGCYVTDCDLPTRPELVTCPECQAWLASEPGRAWVGRWATMFARLARQGYGCPGFTARDGWPDSCAECGRPRCAHSTALTSYPRNLGSAEPTPVPATESEADMSATVPAQITPADVPVVNPAPDVLAALIAGEPVPAEALTPVAPAVPARLSVAVDRFQLADALKVAAWSAPARTGIPILAGVMLTADTDGLTVATFDYEVLSTTTLAADVAATGRVLVDVKTLTAVIAGLPKVKQPTPAQVRKGITLPAEARMVSLTDTGSALVITYGATRATVPTMPAEDYPTVTLGGNPTTVARIDAGAFSAAVARTVVAAGHDDTLPVLTGILLTTDADGKRLELTASDRYRLAVDAVPWAPIIPDGTLPQEHIAPALVPARTLAYAAKLWAKTPGVIEVAMTYETSVTEEKKGKQTVSTTHTIASTLTLTCGAVSIGTKTLYGTFPAVRVLFPNAYTGTAQVDAHALADTVARVGLVAEKSAPVRLTWAHGAVTVAVGSDDSPASEESMPATVSGDAEGLTIGFNHSYLIDGLRAFPKGASVRIGFTDAKKPAVIDMTDTDAGNYQYLIMPVRLGGAPDKPATPTPATPAPVAEVDTAEPAPVVEPAPVAQVAEVAEVDTTPATPAPVVEPAPVAEVDTAEPAPVTPIEPAPAPAPVALPESLDLCGVTVERVAEILRTGTWSSAVVRVGKGSARRPMGVQVLTLNAGRLDYKTEYKAIANVAHTLGGGWNREAKGFIFEPASVVWGGGYTPEPSAKLAAWLDRHAPGTDATEVTQVAPATQAEPAPVAEVDAMPDVMARALALAVGAYVGVSAVDGNGNPIGRPGYVATVPVDAGRRGIRVMLSDTPGGPSRPVYLRGDSALNVKTPAPVAQVGTVAPAPAPVVELHEPTERAAHVAYTAMTGGDYAGARAAMGDVARIAPVGYRIARRFTVAQLGEMIDAAERAAAPAPAPVAPVEPATPVEPAPVAQVDTVEPPVIAASDAAILAQGVADAAAVMVEPAPAPVAQVDTVEPTPADAARPPAVFLVDPDGMMRLTLAAYAETVNRGEGYKASRKRIHAALRADKIRAVVHADPNNRRAVRVECDPSDRDRVAAIISQAVDTVTPVPASV